MRIVIVGGGVAGVTLALRVLEAQSSASVTLIESGPRVRSADQRVWGDLVARGLNHDPHSHLLEQPDDQEDSGGRVLELMASRYFGLGGTTNVWGGWCLRYQPEDFFLHSNTGFGADWPFDLDALRPYYDRAERTLWVAGDKKPNPAIPFTQKDGVIIQACRKLGISYERLPLARKGSCATIGTCKYCPIEKRYLPQPDIRDLETRFADRFILRTDTSAQEVLMTSARECAGVRVQARNTDGETIPADVVVLALGAIETPKLLLASKSRNHEHGIGNASGHVGRHITAHPLVRVVGYRDGNVDELEQPLDFPTLVSRHFDAPEFQRVGKLLFVNDSRSSVARIEERLREGESLTGIRDSMRASLPFELRGFVEVFSDEANYVELGTRRSSGGAHRTRVSFSLTEATKSAIAWAESEMTSVLKAAGLRAIVPKTRSTVRADHATSTCRMSLSDRDGVVDGDLRVHGTDNLFVCSNAALPNGAAVNPTLTLIALAERLADHLRTFVD
jgi:choline dehydrogenase-like flavoprotein